jgi:hypothetical protein
LIPRVQSPANFRIVSQMSTLPRSTRINRDMAKAMSMVYALRLKGENKKRLLVGRLKIASRRAEMHLLYGMYVVDKHDTGRHCNVHPWVTQIPPCRKSSAYSTP